jgi:hypothetical protein
MSFELAEAGLVLSFIALPLIIIPIIFGIVSIKTFTARKINCAKPIPTLVLGIVGLSSGALAAFFDFLTFCISISMM